MHKSFTPNVFAKENIGAINAAHVLNFVFVFFIYLILSVSFRQG